MKNTVVISFLRCQPPTKAHAAIFKEMYLDTLVFGEPHYIFLSPSENKRNPLTLEFRLDFLRKLYPEYNFVGDQEIRNPFDAMCSLGKLGFEKIIFYCGSDRISKFLPFKNYINHSDPKKNIPTVQEIEFVTFGENRGSGLSGLSELSGTLARKAVVDEDFEKFISIIPVCSLEDQRLLFETVYLGLLG
jgi:hypothetical protein